MSNELRDADYLEHILDAIDKAQRYVLEFDETKFMANDLVQDAVIRNLEIIGEAVTKLSPSLKAQHPDIPWSDISAMRNRLIHGYVTVNLEIVWSTVGKALPAFRTQVGEILGSLGE